MGDVQLLRGAREIQVPGGRFEEAEHLERRKCARHTAMIAALSANVRNDRWLSSHQCRIMQVPGAQRWALRLSGVTTEPSRARRAHGRPRTARPHSTEIAKCRYSVSTDAN
jgi:hypothetical protein